MLEATLLEMGFLMLSKGHRVPEERGQRIRHHNTIWGPFGRNLHEDLLGVTGQGASMAVGTETRNILHGRHENHTIHDEVGMRHYYSEWGKYLDKDPYHA